MTGTIDPMTKPIEQITIDVELLSEYLIYGPNLKDIEYDPLHLKDIEYDLKPAVNSLQDNY